MREMVKNMAETILGQIKETGRASVKQVSALLKHGSEEAQNIALNAMVQVGCVGQAVKSLFKKTVKANELITTIASEVNYNVNSGSIEMTDHIETKKLSPVIRLFKLTRSKLACKGQASKKNSTLDIMAIKISKSVLSQVKNGNAKGFKAIFRMFFKGVEIRYNKSTGMFRFISPDNHTLKRDCEERLIYKFISITASGLRNGTFNFALVSRNGVSCDKRIWALDTLTSGFFSKTFLGEDQVTNEKAFKSLNRLSLGFTDSKKMTEKAGTFVVFKNFSEKAVTKDGRSLENIMDGRVFINSKLLKASKGFESFTLNYIEKQVIQCRAEAHGLKAAGQFMSSNMLKVLAKALIARGTAISYAIVDGVRVEAKDINLEEVLGNLDALFDENGLKYPTNTAMELTLMKQAYASDSKLTMVVNMMMMQIDSKMFKAAVTSAFKKDVISKLKGVGVTIEFSEAGKLVNAVFNEEERKNNDPLFSTFLFKSCPLATIALLPGVLKSQMGTIIESIKNGVNALNPAVDSKYMVVQADLGALLGAPILSCKPGNIECYCGLLNKEDVSRVSAVRNPISSLTSVTTFKLVSLEEIIRRVMASDLTNEEKELVIYSYKKSETYVTIPASHYLMEKHDGMDYDIDAMCFIIDVACVAILSKVRELGTVIPDGDVNRYKKLTSEIAIDEWQKSCVKNKCIMTLDLPQDIAATNKKYDGTMEAEEGAFKPSNKVKKQNPFDLMLGLVEKYFADSNANVGEIANAFYNNALITFALKSYLNDDKKKFVASRFARAYGCKGTEGYKSPVTVTKDTDGFEFITVDKKLCIDTIRAFVNSNGSVESLIMFLEDCCKLNRYPAETAIDAAKNNYKITNFFKHSFIIKAMGSDKVVAAALKNCNEAFQYSNNNAAMILGVEPKAINSLEIESITLDTDGDGKPVIDIFACNSEELVADNAIKAMPELLFDVKDSLRVWSNEVIALAANVLVDKIESVEAQELRDKATEMLIDTDRNGINLTSLVKNLNLLVTTENSIAKQNVEFDDQSSVLWHKEKGLVRLANTIAVAFKQDKVTLTDTQIGGSFIATMLDGKDIMNGEYGRVSLKTLDAFAKYVLAYYKSIGLDVNAYEKIAIGERGYKVSDLNDMECIVADGHAYCDNGYILTLDNHKADVGLGVVSDGYIKFDRKTVELDPEEGIYIYGKADKKTCLNIDKANGVMEDYSNVQYLTKETVQVAKIVTDVNGNRRKTVVTQKGVTGLVYMNKNICYRLSDRNQWDETREYGYDHHMRLMNSNILTNLKNVTFKPFAVTTNDGKNINLIVRIDGATISSAINRAKLNMVVEAEQTTEDTFIMNLPMANEAQAPTKEEIPAPVNSNGICW